MIGTPIVFWLFNYLFQCLLWSCGSGGTGPWVNFHESHKFPELAIPLQIHQRGKHMWLVFFYKKRKNQNSGKNHWNSWIINETTRLLPHCVVPIRAMERSTQDNTSKIFFSSTSSFTAGFCSHQSPSLLLVIVAPQHMFAASFNIRLELGRKYEFRDFTHKCLLLASTKSPQSPISSRAYFHYKL